MIRLVLPCVLGMCAINLAAQIGLPGQYPGGGSPFPGGGRRFPGGSNGGGNNPPGRTPTSRKKDGPIVTTTFGILRKAGGNQFILEADDHRILTYKTNDRTTVTKDSKSAVLTAFSAGDHLTVDSTEDDDGYFTATAVRFEKPGTQQDQEAAEQTWDLPTLAQAAPAGGRSSGSAGRSSNRNSDDDDRPVLRRANGGGSSAPAPDDAPSTANNAGNGSNGKAAPKSLPADSTVDVAADRPTTEVRRPDPPPDTDDPGVPQLKRGAPVPRRRPAAVADSDSSSSGPLAVAQPGSSDGRTAPSSTGSLAGGAPAGVPELAAIKIEEDPIIQKAKEAAAEFYGVFPNFFCQQMTTRYESDQPKRGWNALDVVAADVVYEDGRESYRNIKVGSRSVSSMDETGGSHSTGEFASVLEDLFSPLTAAEFKRSGTDTVSGRSTYVFKFDVPREHSHWRIGIGGQLYYPAYRGSLWIDKGTSRVLRIEMQARNTPLLFPLDTTEMAVDYDLVRLSAMQSFLLPVDSEMLSCQRGTSHCSRNRIEFRNYRKFGAESDITFGNPN